MTKPSKHNIKYRTWWLTDWTGLGADAMKSKKQVTTFTTSKAVAVMVWTSILETPK